MLDSFCVDNDEEELEEESSAMLPEEDVLSPVCLPPGRRTRRGGLVRQDAKTNGRARKRIIIQPDSSDSDAASPVKKPSPSILEVSSVPTAASTSGTSSFSQSREERLEKQRVKKEEFRRTMATGAASTSVPSSDRFVVPSAIASNAATSRVLISSRQVSTAGQIISSLQVKHKCQTHVCSFPVADFVVSPQLGVLRKLHSGQLIVLSVFRSFVLKPLLCFPPLSLSFYCLNLAVLISCRFHQWEQSLPTARADPPSSVAVRQAVLDRGGGQGSIAGRQI